MSEINHKNSDNCEERTSEQPDPDDSSTFKHLEQFTAKNNCSVRS